VKYIIKIEQNFFKKIYELWTENLCFIQGSYSLDSYRKLETIKDFILMSGFKKSLKRFSFTWTNHADLQREKVHKIVLTETSNIILLEYESP